MNYSHTTNNRRDLFPQFVAISLAAHLLFGVAAVVKFNFFPSEDIFIQNAIKVDLVALPEKQSKKATTASKAIKKPVVAPVKKKKKKANKKVNLKNKIDTKAAQKKALQELMRKSALDDIKKTLSDEKIAKENEMAEEVVAQPVKGNIISDGSNLEGLDQIQYQRYYSKVSSIVKKNWNLPQWLASANLSGEVAIRLDERGYVVSSAIEQTSGNSVFDDTILASIKSSSPFPAPESRMVSVITKITMVLSFP